MDTLKSLMDKHEFELVIKLTEKSNDIDSIFYRISALLGIGKPEQALRTLKEHHSLLQKNLYLLIKVHIDLLIILGKFDEAYCELDYYKNLPYESQQVEELLSSMVGYIRHEEKLAYKPNVVSDEEIKSRLKSEDQGKVVSALELLTEKDLNLFMNEIKFVMVNSAFQNLRTFALLLLVSKKIDKEFDFKSSNGLIKVNPSKIKPPFVGEPFNRVSKRMITEFKNPSISDPAIDLFSRYILEIYPSEVKDDDNYIIGALFVLCCRCLQMKDCVSLDDYASTHSLEVNKLKNLYNEFEKIIEN